MEHVKISIIIPVYNVGIYLKETLDTVFTQSFKKFELICVDDASTDYETQSILRDYEGQHENMQVIWLKNRIGAGQARNIGFKKAEGQYTIFLDADDLFDETFLERMYRSITGHNADVCICGHKNFYMENGVRCFGGGWMPNGEIIDDYNRERWLLDVSTVAWDKLCKTDFLKKNNIFFQSLRSCNDVFFACSVMIHAKKKSYIEEIPLILYRIHTSNQISANRNPLDLYKALILLRDTEQEKGANPLLKKWIGALLLRNGVWESKVCRDESSRHQFYELAGNFFDKHKIHFYNELLEACTEKMRCYPYDSRWFYHEMDFLGQLRLTGEKLKNRICGSEPLFLWGMGVRGIAFQEFCKERGIRIWGVADIKNDRIGDKTKYGNKILSTEELLHSKGLIVASTKEIFNYLSDKNVRCINLEEFCFI